MAERPRDALVKKIVAGPIDQFYKSSRVNVQTKTDQKVQCNGGSKINTRIYVTINKQLLLTYSCNAQALS